MDEGGSRRGSDIISCGSGFGRGGDSAAASAAAVVVVVVVVRTAAPVFFTGLSSYDSKEGRRD